MRITIVGASGNIGSALVRELLSRDEHDIIGVARRQPDPESGAVESRSITWRAADIAQSDLDAVLSGADVLVHLAWLFQPTHDRDFTWEANAIGTRRLLDAAGRQGVGTVICASSIAAYSPGPGRTVEEDWPTDGPSSAAYAREKAYVERLLDIFEHQYPQTRVVRFRPAFVFQRSAATEQRRIFGGPLLPGRLLDPRIIPVLPVPRGFHMQTVHSEDLARALAAAIERPVQGAFNVAAEGSLGRDDLADLFEARVLDVPAKAVGLALDAAWRLHLAPAPADLFEAFMRLPTMSCRRARTELGWEPEHSATSALAAFLAGAREGAGKSLPPLDPANSGPLRAREFGSGVGSTP